MYSHLSFDGCTDRPSQIKPISISNSLVVLDIVGNSNTEIVMAKKSAALYSTGTCLLAVPQYIMTVSIHLYILKNTLNDLDKRRETKCFFVWNMQKSFDEELMESCWSRETGLWEYTAGASCVAHSTRYARPFIHVSSRNPARLHLGGCSGALYQFRTVAARLSYT